MGRRFLIQSQKLQSRCLTSTGQERRRSPDDLTADHQTQIDKLERAVEILGESNPEAAPLVVALKKLRVQVSSLVGERLDACQQFVERAQEVVRRSAGGRRRSL